jgi:hypothetical protein
MQKRTLGKNGLEKKDSIALLRAAVELSAEDLRQIETALSQIQVEGARYPEALEKVTGR